MFDGGILLVTATSCTLLSPIARPEYPGPRPSITLGNPDRPPWPWECRPATHKRDRGQDGQAHRWVGSGRGRDGGGSSGTRRPLRSLDEPLGRLLRERKLGARSSNRMCWISSFPAHTGSRL